MTIGTLCRCGRINCDQHKDRARTQRAAHNNRRLGRDSPHWRKLSKMARAQHPYCSRCHTREHAGIPATKLTVDLVGGGDHANARIEQVRVLCAGCHGREDGSRRVFQVDAQ